MQIKIQNYEMLNFENYSLIGSEKGISRIRSKRLIAALEELKAICDTPLEIKTLDSIFAKHRLDKKSTLRQLSDHLVIDNDIPPPYFEAVYILHGWDEFKEQTTSILNNEALASLSHLTLHQDTLKKINKEKSLIVLLPGSYNTERLKQIYFEISSSLPRSFLICGYFSPSTFTVTQPYSVDLGNPCLFCSLSRAIHFEAQADGACAWSAVLNFCTSNSAEFKNPKLSALQHSMVVGLILKKINQLLGDSKNKAFQDNILTNLAVNLNTGAVSEETLPHWHMCDCLRANHAKHTA